MAWNKINNKDLSAPSIKAAIGPGAPVSINPSFAGKAYRDPWDIERAYREGMQKVTWVSRCIDAIAGNQARLPMVLRKNNSPDGEIVKGRSAKNSKILDLLNTKSNIGENSYIFRYRLSSQLLMSTRGAFIEKIKGRDGSIIGLNLLPPQSTAPMPDPRNFVSGYEVLMPTGDKVIMKPDDVIWVRRPHPLDPYLSLTPMESAGIAIEIENLAKLYNRNYLLNDGRPGGLLVLRGEIDDDDRAELQNRFRGNLGRVGSTTVISSDDGVDYVDTSSNPRDAAYIQMRQITKEEILASFGVPETVIGNAAGRTFSNASEEVSVFWNETMSPHLEIIARALDALDDEHYIDFDTSDVPVLILAKQERARYLMQEMQSGTISTNEYREATGRKKVESDLADSLLMNPNLTPIANTEKKMEAPAAPGAPGMPPGAPGMPPGVPGMPGMPPGVPGAEGGMPPVPGMEAGGMPDMGVQAGPALDPNTMAGALAEEAGMAPVGSGQFGQMSAQNGLLQTKSELVDLEVNTSRWTQIADRSLERIIERQQRVVLEKLDGAKSRKALKDGTLDVDALMPSDTWDKQMDEDMRPVLSAIYKDSQSAYSEKSAGYAGPSSLDVQVQIEAQMGRIKTLNEDSRNEIREFISNGLSIKDEESRHAYIRASIVTMFSEVLAIRKPEVAREEATRAWLFCRP